MVVDGAVVAETDGFALDQEGVAGISVAAFSARISSSILRWASPRERNAVSPRRAP